MTDDETDWDAIEAEAHRLFELKRQAEVIALGISDGIRYYLVDETTSFHIGLTNDGRAWSYRWDDLDRMYQDIDRYLDGAA
jgi:hypothetical protein